MAYLFDNISAFDSPLFIAKDTTDSVINLLNTPGMSISSDLGSITNGAYLYDYTALNQATLVCGGAYNQFVIDLGVGITKTADTIIMANYTNASAGATTITLQGSNNALNYSTIYTKSNISGTYVNFIGVGSNSTAYRYYRIIFFFYIPTTTYVGELILCKSTNLIYSALPGGVMSIVNNYFEKVSYNELVDGSFIGAITSVKYGATYGYEWLPQADRDTLKTLKDTKTDIIVIPSPQTTSELYHVYWTSPWNFSFTDKYQGAGWSGSIDVREL